MSAHPVILAVIAIIMFLRAAGSYLKQDMIGTFSSAGIGVFFVIGACVAGSGSKKPAGDGGGPTMIALSVLLLAGLGGVIWWQVAGPGAHKDEGAATPKHAPFPGLTAAPVAEHVAPVVPSGPAKEEVDKHNQITALATSKTLHRADITVAKSTDSQLYTIKKQVAALPGVIAVGEQPATIDGKTTNRLGVIYDSAVTDIKKIASPIEFEHKVKFDEVDDAAITGSAVAKVVHVRADGIAEFQPELPESAEDRAADQAKAETAHRIIKDGYRVAGFRLYNSTSDDQLTKLGALVHANPDYYLVPPTPGDERMVHIVYHPSKTKLAYLVNFIKGQGLEIQANDDNPCPAPPQK